MKARSPALTGVDEEALRSQSDPWKALHANGCAYVRFAMENPGWFRLAFSQSQTEGADDHMAASHIPTFVPLQLAALSSRFGRALEIRRRSPRLDRAR